MWISASNTWNKSIFGEGSKHYRHKCKFSKWFKNSLGQVKGQHNQNVCKPYHVGSLWCNCLEWGWSANHTHQEKMKKRVQHRVRSSEALRLMVTNSWARPWTKGDWNLGQKAAKGTTNHVVSSDWFDSGTCKNHQHCHIQTWFVTGSESNRIHDYFLKIHLLGRPGKAWVELMPRKKPFKCLADSLHCTANS